jgi:REP element-mobilizing transposase RayT
MAQPLRVEDPNSVFFLTTRTIGAKLWFVNNPTLDERILAYLAKYQTRFEVELFAFVLMGNHYHLIARFPRGNKAAFMRAFNAIIAKLTAANVPEFVDGKLWARRYSEQTLPRSQDIRHWFFYAALNPTLSGLTEDPLKYPSYNSFRDSSAQKKRTFTVFDKHGYNEAKRRGQNVEPSQFMETFTLRWSKLPGLHRLSNEDYRRHLEREFRTRLGEAVKTAEGVGKKFPSLNLVKSTSPGTRPKFSKKSHRYSFRPLVLTLCFDAKIRFLNRYFTIVDQFKRAVSRLKNGLIDTPFPRGTYRPWGAAAA